MTSNISPDEFLSELLNNVNVSTRRKRSLEMVHSICKEQHERGSKDFSVATIGRLSQEAGGPSERTIRNKEGELYRSLIHAWVNHTNGVTRKPTAEKESSIVDEILERISDPTIRALVGVIMAENRKLKGENSLLKRSTNLTLDMRNQTVLNPGKIVEITSPSYNLLPVEIDALRHAVSEDLLTEQGWTTDEQGRIKHKGRPVFKAGFITAIKKVLESTSN